VILEISCEGHQTKIELSTSAGTRKVAVNGEEISCDWIRLPGGHCSLIVGGRVYDFIIQVSDENCCVIGREGSHTLYIADPRRLTPGQGIESGPSGLQRLKAEMPGKVIRILVKEGDRVEFDQGLLVLEAMKMQNEIRAPKSGVVREIRVTPGIAVNTGEFLLCLE
jgi:biotin carboxyl carrier protein